MAFNISEFRQRMQFGGARPNYFEVDCVFPDFVGSGSAAGEKFRFMCKAASIPAFSVNSVNVPYFGRSINLGGDRPEFEDWNITVINDEDFLVRNAFEEWVNGIAQINGDTNTLRDPSAVGVNSYVSDLVVRQYSKGGNVIKQYKIQSAMPTNVEPIELSWETNNTVEEFAVTLKFDDMSTQGTDSVLGSGAFSVNSQTPF